MGGRWEDDRLAAAEQGVNPTVLGRLRTGWAVIGDTQHLPGYCLLLYRGTADHLTDLPRDVRADFLLDMSLLGEAVQNVCRARDPEFNRINYEILGNSWAHLHAHVHPRYAWEPAEHRNKPVWTYPDRKHPRHALTERRDRLRVDLEQELARIAGLLDVDAEHARTMRPA
jgi:diadenosine tetraphosphate (Ap4A) HIT family hydrolase